MVRNAHPTKLGCRMTSDDSDRILAAIAEHMPHAGVYQSKRSDSSFVLEFEELK